MRAAFVLCTIATIVLTCQGLTDEQKAKVLQHHVECQQETQVNPEVMRNAIKGTFVNDPKLAEHLFCVSKKIGFQNESGDIQLDVIRTKLGTDITDEELLEKLIQKCAHQQESSVRTAASVFKCFQESSPTPIFTV